MNHADMNFTGEVNATVTDAAQVDSDGGDDSVETRITVTNKLGLHARAAAQLVKLAAGFECAIHLSFAPDSPGNPNGKTADAKSIMEVMMLAAAQGSKLQLSARGNDARAAAQAVSELFAARFGEGE